MEQITWTQYFVIMGICIFTMLLCRVIPLLLLKGKKLSPTIEQTLGFIPPAAFAALAANDLLTPGMFASGIWPAASPLIASLIVVVAAKISKSLIVCVIVGVAAYGLLMFAQ